MKVKRFFFKSSIFTTYLYNFNIILKLLLEKLLVMSPTSNTSPRCTCSSCDCFVINRYRLLRSQSNCYCVIKRFYITFTFHFHDCPSDSGRRHRRAKKCTFAYKCVDIELPLLVHSFVGQARHKVVLVLSAVRTAWRWSRPQYNQWMPRDH